MAIESDADRLSFLSDWDSALYNGTDTIYGVFNNEFADELGVESSNPTFLCRDTDISGVVHGDTLVVNSTDYVVAGIESDGTGMTLLQLHEA